MFAGAKRGARGNNKEPRLPSRRGASEGAAPCYNQLLPNLQRFRLPLLFKTLQPITRQFHPAPTKFFDELSRVLSGRARDFEL